MKKKRLRLVTTIAILAALFGSGGGTAWGQRYVLNNNGTTNVNNQFGAGESSKLSPGTNGVRSVISPWAVPIFNYTTDGSTPAPNTPFGGTYSVSPMSVSPVTDIQLGGKKNTVIRSYTGDGFASGWVTVQIKARTGPYPSTTYTPVPDTRSFTKPIAYNTSFTSSPDYEPITTGDLFEISFNKFNSNLFEHSSSPCKNPWHANWGVASGCALSDPYAPCGGPLFSSTVTNHSNGTSTVDVAHHDGNHRTVTVSPSARPHGIYTTTIDGNYTKTWQTGSFQQSIPTPIMYPTDDGVALVQFTGSIMADSKALVNQPRYKLKSDAAHPLGDVASSAFTTPAEWGDTSKTKNLEYLTNYRRPTTILVQSPASITPNNPAPNHTFKNFIYKDIDWEYEIDTVRATPLDINNASTGATLTWCNSGYYTTFVFRVAWEHEVRAGATLVDGAVVVQPNAWVCVENNVKDQTTYRGSQHTTGNAPDAKTDAMLVFPDINIGRFTFRVKGDIDSIGMAQDVTNTDLFYKQETFPRPEKDILLGIDAANAHPFSDYHLGQFRNNNPSAFITNHPIAAAPVKAEASIFGVYGNYRPAAADTCHIHTDTASLTGYKDEIPGVIELGPRGTGRGHMHAYSGGMVKNFESCTPLTNFTMHFGGEFGTPDLKITKDKPLYIMNYGNNSTNGCDAKMIFHYTATDTVQDAINGNNYVTPLTQGDGPLRIQALSDVEFRTDETWTPGKQNNLLVLSDGGNVITQKVNYTGKYSNGIAEGLLTFWAEDYWPNSYNFSSCGNTTANRNSLRGNVYMNHDVSVTRAPGGTTETNVIAANNVRTTKFTFTSTNTDKDTTNVISRKGDLYLGYGEAAPYYPAGSSTVTSNGTTTNTNLFDYTISAPANEGVLNIKAGWDDTQTNMTMSPGMEGGNVYFTGIKTNMAATGKYPTFITIPYSSEYICDAHVNGELLHNRKNTYQAYEHSGIIGGVGACGKEGDWSHYGGNLIGAASALTQFTQKSLEYNGNKGHLTVDAGKRGNIIMNTGGLLDFQNDNGNAIFRTREGDIDMRDPFDAKEMTGSLLFLAQIEDLGKLTNIGVCGCDEERNNVYLQDFKYIASTANNSGSVFVGADNNIKLNYGGLTNIGTRQDPFLSKPYETHSNGAVKKIGRGYTAGGGCGTSYHCDLDGSENKARDLELNFNGSVTSGGFAAVASDMIDVYKNLIYHGGTGSGLSTVPGTGTLHGEAVAGYGLYMKTQGNKHNWTDNILLQAPKCPTTCAPTGCGENGRPATAFLHNTVRMTFHSDARFYAENQRVHLESPVIETFGVLELNAQDNAGANAMITIKTDSLICHDSLIRKGKGKVQLTTWSGLPKDQPIIKLGYSRKAAPFKEYAYDDGATEKICRECVTHYKGKVYAPGETPLDTMFVKFGPDTEWERQNVMVVDHTVISFLTDSFDHVKGGDVRHARYFVDTTKIRHQVEFWTDAKHERDGHLELISEEQMGSKDYAGLYTRHLHLEPIGACERPTSELWLPGLALDVITTSTFGGFGIQYTDVHVENGANLNPGFTSLRLRGQCYEQACGTLTMKDLRLDGGSELHFSVGTTKGLNGEYSDAIDVDRLTTYGPVNVNIEIRPCEKMQKRCYPIMYYKSVTPNSLNNLKLNPRKVKIDGEEYPLSLNVSTDGIVYVCVGDAVTPGLTHTVTMPETAGVKTTPSKGIYPLPTRTSFRFSATYSGAKPLVVRTNRKVNGQQEVLNGVKNANGEYEYIVPSVQQEVTLTFGPDVVANELLTAGTAVWSHGEKIYIRVERADIASIYSVAGQLVKRVDLPEGDTSIPMSRGAYVITLKDGSVHKVIVK